MTTSLNRHALDFANSFKNSIIRTLEGISKIDVLGPVPSFIQKSDDMSFQPVFWERYPEIMS